MNCPNCGKKHRSYSLAERCNSDATNMYNRCVISGVFPEGVKENYIKARSYLWSIKNRTGDADLSFIRDVVMNDNNNNCIINEYEELLSLTFAKDYNY